MWVVCSLSLWACLSRSLTSALSSVDFFAPSLSLVLSAFCLPSSQSMSFAFPVFYLSIRFCGSKTLLTFVPSQFGPIHSNSQGPIQGLRSVSLFSLRFYVSLSNLLHFVLILPLFEPAWLSQISLTNISQKYLIVIVHSIVPIRTFYCSLIHSPLLFFVFHLASI